MKTNAILAAILVIAGSLAYYFEVQKKPDRDKADADSKKLYSLDPNAELEHVEIHFDDKGKKTDVSMNCSANCKLSDPNAQWDLVSPIKFPGESGNITGFATSVLGTIVNQSLPLDGDLEKELAKFGLDAAHRNGRKAILKFKSKPNPITVYVGDDAAVQGSLYVYLDADGVPKNKVHMTPDYIKTHMQRATSYWRRKRIFDFATSRVEKIRLENKDGTADLEKKGSSWFYKDGKLADDSTIDTFLTGVAFMNATDYVSDDAKSDRAKFKLVSKPVAKLSLGLSAPKDAKDAKSETLVFEIFDGFVDKNPKRFLVIKGSTLLIDVDHTATDKFMKKPAEFRYRYFLTQDQAKDMRRAKISFTGDGKTIDLRSEDGLTWTLASGDVKNFDGAHAGEALRGLRLIKIQEYVAAGSIPAKSKLRSTWELSDKDGKLLRKVALYWGDDRAEPYAIASDSKGSETVKMDKSLVVGVADSATAFSREAAAASSAPAQSKALEHLEKNGVQVHSH